MLISELYKCYLSCSSVSTDTRKIEDNSIFFALSGPNFNGNSFAKDALNKGASYVVIDDTVYYEDDDRYILVNDSLKSLQVLANYHRKKITGKVLALTGSNGKTTTKELINVVLQSKFKTYCTQGNLNNHIGVPLTILACERDVDFLIVEMGANHQGEIRELCRIAMPDYGLITNIGKAHLEGFGGIEGVKKGKGELFEYILENNKIAFINNDVKSVNDITPNNLRTITYNSKLVNNSNLKEEIRFIYDSYKIQTNLVGAYNFQNMVHAIGIGNYFGIEGKLIKSALESYLPQNNRSQFHTIGNATIFMDAYNANPTSMAESINAFINRVGSKNALIIIGDMLELGETSEVEHRAILSLISKNSNIPLVAIGPNFYQFKEEFKQYDFFENVSDYCTSLNLDTREEIIIFLKGSRGIKLEKIVTYLETLKS